MTKRRSEIPFEKKILNLGVGDFEAMGNLFPALGPTVAIRTLIRNYILKVRAATAPLDIEIPDGQIEELLDDPR